MQGRTASVNHRAILSWRFRLDSRVKCAIVALLAGGASAGCATPVAEQKTASLSPADFRNADNARAATEPASETSREAQQSGALTGESSAMQQVSQEAAGGIGRDVRVLAGPPASASRNAPPAPALATIAPTNQPGNNAPKTSAADSSASTAQTSATPTGEVSGGNGMSVDALVGQINGRPVFASEFLAPMDARLRAEADRLQPREWLEFARSEIGRALRSRVVNELLLAEARASLSPEQRQGLLAFIENFRDSLVSQSAGSQEQAERTLLEREGTTLDEKAREMLDQELLRMQLRSALVDEAQVSWREVELEYERRKAEFNPPPTATIRMIRVRKDDMERIARIETALRAGESFAAIAQRESEWNPQGGGLYPREGAFQLDGPSLAESSVFGPAPLNEAATSLSPGDWVGPIELSDDVYWIHLEKLEQTERSLFEAQLELFDRLRSDRLQQAEQRYLEDLIGRGSLTDIERMQQRLVRFAIERYLLDDSRS